METRYASLWPELTPEPPLVSGPLAVFPLLDDDVLAPRDYLLLSNAIETGLVRVTEVNETGQVPTLRVENDGALPVLAVQGEGFHGAKQNRSLNVSLLLAPGKHEIPVTCVEQGRWRSVSRLFDKGHMEHTELRRLRIRSITEELFREQQSGRKPRRPRYATSQLAAWDEIRRKIVAHRLKSPTSALSDVYEDRKTRTSLNDMVGGLQLPKNTRGVAMAIAGKLQWAEVFESSHVFARVWPRLSLSYALSGLGQAEDAPPSMAEVAGFLRGPAAEEGVEVVKSASVGLGEDVRWRGKSFTAAGLEWKERLLHGVAFARSEM